MFPVDARVVQVRIVQVRVAQMSAIAASLILSLPIVLPEYNPPDVGGPSSSQGSGTRYTPQATFQPAQL